MPRALLATAVLGVLLLPGAAAAQSPAAPDPHAGHAMPTPSPTPTPDPHAGHAMPMPSPAASADSHAGHVMPTRPPAGSLAPTGHLVSEPPPARVDLPAFVPPVTEDMRRAAFPDVHGHASHDRMVNTFVLFDQLEGQFGNGPGSVAWSQAGWVGGDINRVWFRTEGDGADGRLHEGDAHVLYGRAVARWWDVVGGVRQDFQPGAQTWLAFGVQGLAPGFFEVQATAYVSDAGQTAARFELEYDLLITNRLVLQPVVEANLYGKTNAALGVGRGLSSAEAGVRLRYEFRREFAPYVGVTWGRTFVATTDLAGDEGAGGRPRLVTGLRLWF